METIKLKPVILLFLLYSILFLSGTIFSGVTKELDNQQNNDVPLKEFIKGKTLEDFFEYYANSKHSDLSLSLREDVDFLVYDMDQDKLDLLMEKLLSDQQFPILISGASSTKYFINGTEKLAAYNILINSLERDSLSSFGKSINPDGSEHVFRNTQKWEFHPEIDYQKAIKSYVRIKKRLSNSDSEKPVPFYNKNQSN